MRTKRRWLIVVVTLALCMSGHAADTNDVLPTVILRAGTNITLEAQSPVSPAEVAHIRQLIHNLANITHPDSGFSGTFSGHAFTPVPGLDEFSGGILEPGNAETSDEVVALVKLGPKALPYLLEALDNPTKTKLEIRMPVAISGAMWFADELEGNPANLNEARVIESRPRMDAAPFASSPRVDQRTYAVTVGDICFAIIGQIVNRPYEAARYQMTACVVLNSPVHDPVLAKEVRQVWAATNSTQHLMDSLLTDFATEKIEYNGERMFPSRWMDPSDLRCGAATRLLYYFPKETTDLITDRLREFEKSGVTNGSDAAGYIGAVGWSTMPAIRGEIKRIFENTFDADLLLASAHSMGISNNPVMRNRIETLIGALPASENEAYGQGYTLLYELANRYGVDAKPVFMRYVKNASTQRCETTCLALGLNENDSSWCLEVLAPLLDDKRRVGYETTVGEATHYNPHRVCDETADIISRKFPKMIFRLGASDDELDKQIKKMQEQIEKKEY